MVLGAAASLTLSVYLTNTRQHLAFFLSPPRAWEFATGALGFLTLQERKPRLAYANLVGFVGLLGILGAALAFNKSTTFPGFSALLPALSTVLVLYAGAQSRETGVVSVLRLRPLQELGRLSYSWYLWHWPVLVLASQLLLLRRGKFSLYTELGLLTASLVAAELSYRLVENPIRLNRYFASHSVHSLGLAAILSLFAAVLSIGWHAVSRIIEDGSEQRVFTKAGEDIPTLYEQGCHADMYDVRVAGCTFGSDGSSMSLVLFGDSHAAQWFPPLESASRTNGWQLITMTKSSCPPVDVDQYDSRLHRSYKECAKWRGKAIEKIRAIHPNFTLISAYSNGYPFTDEEWSRGTLSVLRELSKSSQHVIVIRDSPRAPFDVPSCLARKAWRSALHIDAYLPGMRSCDFKLDLDGASQPLRVFHVQLQAAKQFRNVKWLDMTSAICPAGICRTLRGNTVVYRDYNHLTTTFTESLARSFSAKIFAVVSQAEN